MATIEEKILSVKSGDAETNPYQTYLDRLTIIMNRIVTITYENLDDPSNPHTASNEIWSAWNAMVTQRSIVLTAISTTIAKLADHYNDYWLGASSPGLDYKSIPALLNGVWQIKQNVAIEDAGGDTLSEEDQIAAAATAHNYLYWGTISMSNEEEITETNDLLTNLEDIVNGVPDVLQCWDPAPINDWRNLLTGEIKDLQNEIYQLWTRWVSIEVDEKNQALEYAKAYGAVMFAEQNPDTPAVAGLMGDLP